MYTYESITTIKRMNIRSLLFLQVLHTPYLPNGPVPGGNHHLLSVIINLSHFLEFYINEIIVCTLSFLDSFIHSNYSKN